MQTKNRQKCANLTQPAIKCNVCRTRMDNNSGKEIVNWPMQQNLIQLLAVAVVLEFSAIG
jgi:hypothetical protein